MKLIKVKTEWQYNAEKQKDHKEAKFVVELTEEEYFQLKGFNDYEEQDDGE